MTSQKVGLRLDQLFSVTQLLDPHHSFNSELATSTCSKALVPKIPRGTAMTESSLTTKSVFGSWAPGSLNVGESSSDFEFEFHWGPVSVRKQWTFTDIPGVMELWFPCQTASGRQHLHLTLTVFITESLRFPLLWRMGSYGPLSNKGGRSRPWASVGKAGLSPSSGLHFWTVSCFPGAGLGPNGLYYPEGSSMPFLHCLWRHLWLSLHLTSLSECLLGQNAHALFIPEIKPSFLVCFLCLEVPSFPCFAQIDLNLSFSLNKFFLLHKTFSM